MILSAGQIRTADVDALDVNQPVGEFVLTAVNLNQGTDVSGLFNFNVVTGAISTIESNDMVKTALLSEGHVYHLKLRVADHRDGFLLSVASYLEVVLEEGHMIVVGGDYNGIVEDIDEDVSVRIALPEHSIEEDGDAVFKYSISNNVANKMFMIEVDNAGNAGSNASLVLESDMALDYEDKGSFDFKVTVIQSGYSQIDADIRVRIAVNDVNEAPLLTTEFEGMTVEFPVNILGGITLLDEGSFMAEDPEGGILSYSLSAVKEGDNSDASSLFAVDAVNGVISIGASPSFTVGDMYVVTLEVRDDGTEGGIAGASGDLASEVDLRYEVVSSRLVFFPTGGRDLVVLESINGEDFEMVVPGAIDVGGDVNVAFEYEIISVNDVLGDGVFGLEVSGVVVKIVLDGDEEFDYEVEQMYEIVVGAEDSANPNVSGQIVLTVDVEDVNEVPEVEIGGLEVLANNEKVLRVPYNAYVGYVVLPSGSITAVDPEGEGLTYSMKVDRLDPSGAYDGYFKVLLEDMLEIDKRTGEITVSSIDDIRDVVDGEIVRAEVTLQVSASGDDGKGRESFRIEIGPVVAIGFDVVGRSVMVGEDEGSLVRILIPRAGLEGLVPSANVTFTYEVIGGDGLGIFEAGDVGGNNEGYLVMASGMDLDYESVMEYTVLVQATQDIRPSVKGVVEVMVGVLDVNEAPVIMSHVVGAIGVPENMNDGADILSASSGTYTVYDMDEADREMLRYSMVAVKDSDGSDASDLFVIEEMTGSVSMASGTEYSLVIGDTYTLTLIVRDRGTPVLEDRVDIRIEIDREASILIESGSRDFYFSEDPSVNGNNGPVEIVLPRAILSSDSSVLVEYEITGGSGSHLFLMGAVGTNAFLAPWAGSYPFDAEVATNYELEFTASVVGSSKVIMVQVYIEDVNDTAPVITSHTNGELIRVLEVLEPGGPEIFNIRVLSTGRGQEGNEPGKNIARLVSEDADGVGGSLTYSVSYSLDPARFTVEEYAGLLQFGVVPTESGLFTNVEVTVSDGVNVSVYWYNVMVVSAPEFSYRDTGTASPYTDFDPNPDVLYEGSNDGFTHVAEITVETEEPITLTSYSGITYNHPAYENTGGVNRDSSGTVIPSGLRQLYIDNRSLGMDGILIAAGSETVDFANLIEGRIRYREIIYYITYTHGLNEYTYSFTRKTNDAGEIEVQAPLKYQYITYLESYHEETLEGGEFGGATIFVEEVTENIYVTLDFRGNFSLQEGVIVYKKDGSSASLSDSLSNGIFNDIYLSGGYLYVAFESNSNVSVYPIGNDGMPTTGVSAYDIPVEDPLYSIYVSGGRMYGAHESGNMMSIYEGANYGTPVGSVEMPRWDDMVLMNGIFHVVVTGKEVRAFAIDVTTNVGNTNDIEITTYDTITRGDINFRDIPELNIPGAFVTGFQNKFFYPQSIAVDPNRPGRLYVTDRTFNNIHVIDFNPSSGYTYVRPILYGFSGHNAAFTEISSYLDGLPATLHSIETTGIAVFNNKIYVGNNTTSPEANIYRQVKVYELPPLHE